MSDFTSPWQGYDFSGLSAALSRIQEITRPALEALQNIQSTLQPIVEALEQYKPKVEEIGQVLLHVSRRFSAIEKMGDAQFVFWDYMTEEFVDEIVDSENISKTLREQMLRDRFSKVNRTIDKTLSSPAMQKHKRLYSQSAEAFRDGNSDLAVTGFTSVFDGLLTDISGNPTSRLGPRIDVIKKKLDNDEFLDNDEYAMLTLALTLEKTLDSFSAPSDFKGKEPTGLNRHWIAHGRSTRKKSKIDCVKMINLIYGLLLIVDPALSYRIIEYNHHSMKGDLERKKATLIALADKLEPKRAKLKQVSGSLESDLFYLLNSVNVRHNNADQVGKNYIHFVADMKDSDIEQWYDDMYQMCLLAFLELDHLERKERVKKLKEDIQKNG